MKKLNLTRKLKSQIRHRWETPNFIISASITIFIYILAIVYIISFFSSEGLASRIKNANLLELVVTAILILFIPLMILALRFQKNAQAISTGIIVSENQFPEVYNLSVEYANMFGLKNVPRIIISSSSKPISSCLTGYKRHTIILHNMLIEIKNEKGISKPALKFALLREYAHISMGHKSLMRQILTMITQSTPVLSGFLSRSEEYTADRLASAMLGYCSKDYFCIESTGKFLWNDIDIKEVALFAGEGGIFEIVGAFLTSMPPITWRVEASYRMGAFNYEFDELNFDFSKFDFKKSHGRYWFPPKKRGNL